MNLFSWHQHWRARLPSDTPDLDLRLLIEHITGLSPSAQRLRPEHLPDAKTLAHLDACAARRAQGEPLAYILGHQPFYDLDLQVSPATLIPRADSEILVEAALARIPAHSTCTVLDLGTGSGAIALAIAKHRPQTRVLATDSSLAALYIARSNAQRLNITNCAFLRASWLDAIAAHCADIIVSNPPYIAEHDPHLPALRYEPQSALTAAEQGLADIRAIVNAAPRVLKPGGYLLFEHGYDQREALLAITRHWTQVEFLKDYGGNWRVCCCRNTSASSNITSA